MELQRALAELPPQQVANILENLEANPSLLNDGTLDELGKILGISRVDGGYVPIEERKDQ